MTLVGLPGHVMAIRTERGLVAVTGIEYFKSAR
jgi:hypothetical protein